MQFPKITARTAVKLAAAGVIVGPTVTVLKSVVKNNLPEPNGKYESIVFAVGVYAVGVAVSVAASNAVNKNIDAVADSITQTKEILAEM